jgi:hypothetical protein
MEIEKGTPVLWYDTIGQIPIRIGIPIVLTATLNQRVRSSSSDDDIPRTEQLSLL